jgi:glycosyltransferase involved in cell wall biosynthesis
MNDLITICIPTYKRPEVLSVCISSCLAQDYRPLELVISDDSPDDTSEVLVQRAAAGSDVPIRYVRNAPSLGQNANVNALFDLAAGDRLILLHDDDYLLPHAVAALAACWATETPPILAFGRQLMVSDDGTPMDSATKALNATYFRTSDRAGRQSSLLECALLRQIPNNGYLVLTEACRRIRYRPASEMPCGCDTDFGLRLGIAYDAAGAMFIDTLTTAYRNSLVSVSTDATQQAVLMPLDKSRLFDTIGDLKLPPQIEYAREVALASLATGAIKGYSLRGFQRQALRVFFSRFYPMRKRLSIRGCYLLLVIALPRLHALQPLRRIVRPQTE